MLGVFFADAERGQYRIQAGFGLVVGPDVDSGIGHGAYPRNRAAFFQCEISVNQVYHREIEFPAFDGVCPEQLGIASSHVQAQYPVAGCYKITGHGVIMQAYVDIQAWGYIQVEIQGEAAFAGKTDPVAGIEVFLCRKAVFVFLLLDKGDETGAASS